MHRFLAPILMLAALQPAPATGEIEKAFLQGDPKPLRALMARDGHILMSFPDPISFSDQLSSQQALLMLRKIFADHATFGFYSEGPFIPPDGNCLILKTRWSFRDRRNRNPHVFQVFFHLRRNSRAEGRPEWRLTEIKAERL